MSQNDIDDVLDYLTRIKSGRGESSRVNIYELEMQIRLFRTFSKYHHLLLPDFLHITRKNAELIEKRLHKVFDECKSSLNLERLETQLLEFVEGNTILRYDYELKDSCLPEYMDCIGKNLYDVWMLLGEDMSDGADIVDEFLGINLYRKQMKMVQKKMRFLRYLYVSEVNGHVDHEKLEDLETRIQFMADNVGQFCLYLFAELYDIQPDEGEDYTNMLDILSNPQYLLCLMYLKNKKLENFPNNNSAQNIDVAIEFLLVFLNADVSYHVSNGKKLNEVMVKVGAIAGDVLYVVQKLLPSSINKDDTSKVSLCSIQILEKTKDLKEQMETYYKSLKFRTLSQFPTVGGLSFLDSLLRKLKEMSKSESGLHFMMKSNIDCSEKEFSSLTSIFEKEFSSLTSILEKELSSLTFVLRDFMKVQHNHEEILNDLQRRTINLAYEAELSIDSVLVQYNVHWHIFCSLPAIIKEIKHICAKVTEMRPKNLSLKPFSAVESSKQLPTQHSNPVNDEEIVGFENEAEKLIDYLTRGTRELDVIPIVGMGGQGKTTIARKVYNNDIIVSRFDFRAWCIISQTYSRKELLRDIFSQVIGSKDKEDRDDILADMLRKNLMGKRYLIVLDDMWDGMAWDDLRLSFPNDNNGSRILITTRLENVGKQVKYHTDPYYLPFLTTEESRKLLQKKVFQQEVFPPELQDVNLKVAEKCKGLPLVLILVAGIIRKNKMEASWWHEVKEALFDYLDHESEQYSLSTMQLSYDKLPDYLKPCLLYMGIFPEDERIPVSKLISLWIAEGFVQNIESGRLMEEAAEDYLMDLIGSNVIMVSERSYNGKVKTCQVHDVVLHFCLEKSREENFMLAVKGHAVQFRPLDWKGHRVRFSFSEELSKFASLGSKTQKPFHQHLRSVITDNEDFNGSFTIHQVGVARLLKVLDLSSHEVSDFSSAILKPLIHLKYLSAWTECFDFHPEPHLPHLETLIVRGSTALPASFWKMGKLRHVNITCAEFDFEEDKHGILEGPSKLKNLRILRKVSFPSDKVYESYMLLQRCPNLQESDIYFGCTNYFEYNTDSLEISLEWEGLTQLQSLGLSIDRPLCLSKLYLPSNLKKLKIQAINIARVVSILVGLSSLEYIRLSELSSRELVSQIIFIDITFHKLNLLKLVNLDISKWDASEESFPLLETLVIISCHYLEEIPPRFADIPTLKQIKLMYCRNKSLEASAARIKEEVEAIEGCDRIDVTIKDTGGRNIRRL